jgi:hypothetical protein
MPFDIAELVRLGSISYQRQKVYFEKYYHKSMESICFFHIDDNGVVEVVSRGMLKHRFDGVKSERGKGFLNLWLSDPKISIVSKTVYKPYWKNGTSSEERDACGAGVVNLFVPPTYNYIDMPVQNRVALLQPFFDVGVQLCEGNRGIFDNMMKLFARILQYPEKRNGFIVSFVNAPKGCGKDSFMTAIKGLVGENNFIDTARPGDIFGKHAEPKAIVIVMNEMRGLGSKMLRSVMKHFVTAETLIVEPKGKPMYRIKNLSNLFIMTNEDDYFLDGHSRRDIVLQPTAKFSNKNQYGYEWWNFFHKLIRSDRFLSALHDYLMDIDVDEVDWFQWRNECITPTYYRYVERSFHPLIRFMYNYGCHFFSSPTNFMVHEIKKIAEDSYDVTVVDWRLEGIMRHLGYTHDLENLCEQFIAMNLAKVSLNNECQRVVSFNTLQVKMYLQQHYYSHR